MEETAAIRNKSRMPAGEQKLQVLIVDDERVIREGFSRVLLKEGYAVTVVESGRLALERVAVEAYDVVLLDLKMPGLDGMEILRELKEMDPDLVCVMITGYPTIQSAVQAVKLGANDYLTKPCSPDELRIMVAQAVERRKLTFDN